MGEVERSGLGPDDRGLSVDDIVSMSRPAAPPRSPYAPPIFPRNGLDLPDVKPGYQGVKMWRGDEAELADILHAHFFGKYVIAIHGELWQYDPDRRGWWQIPAENVVTWVSRLAGAAVFRAKTQDGDILTTPLKLSASKARGAVSFALARIHHNDTLGDFWTGTNLKSHKRGIVQFRDRAVIVTQESAGAMSLQEALPEPSHRVRAVRVLPCAWRGVPELAMLPKACPALWRIHRDWWGHHGNQEAWRRLLSILEFLGASVLGFAPAMGKALFLYGEGGTGKSTLLDLMTRWCQPSAVASVTPQDMANNRFASARLDGAVLNVVDDLPADAIADAGVWKSAITGGRIDVERKNRDAHGIYPVAGHIYAGNKLPVAVKATSGFWRRWLIVEYDRVFADTERDRPIIDELMGEMELIVAFAVAAFVQTGGKGGSGFTTPACHAAVMEQWDQVSDSVSAFKADRLELLEESLPTREWPKRSDVYRSYRAWCDDVGRRPVSAHEWGARLSALGVRVAKHSSWRVSARVKIEAPD